MKGRAHAGQRAHRMVVRQAQRMDDGGGVRERFGKLVVVGDDSIDAAFLRVVNGGIGVNAGVAGDQHTRARSISPLSAGRWTP